MEETQDKELLSVREVAGMLDLCERSVYRMADAGKIPHPIKLGSRSLFRRKEILAWLDAGCKPIRGRVA